MRTTMWIMSSASTRSAPSYPLTVGINKGKRKNRKEKRLWGSPGPIPKRPFSTAPTEKKNAFGEAPGR